MRTETARPFGAVRVEFAGSWEGGTMKRLLLLSVVLMVAAVALSATPLPCVGVTNVAALIATNVAGGCTSQGGIFSNFSYSGSVTAANVLATLVVQDTFGQNGDGWSLGPVGGWTSNFTIGFNVTLTSNTFLGVTSLNQTVDQIFAGPTRPSNTVTASDIETGGVTPSPLSMNALTPGGETAQSNVYSLTAITTATTAHVPSGKGLSSRGSRNCSQGV